MAIPKRGSPAALRHRSASQPPPPRPTRSPAAQQPSSSAHVQRTARPVPVATPTRVSSFSAGRCRADPYEVPDSDEERAGRAAGTPGARGLRIVSTPRPGLLSLQPVRDEAGVEVLRFVDLARQTVEDVHVDVDVVPETPPSRTPRARGSGRTGSSPAQAIDVEVEVDVGADLELMLRKRKLASPEVVEVVVEEPDRKRRRCSAESEAIVIESDSELPAESLADKDKETYIDLGPIVLSDDGASIGLLQEEEEVPGPVPNIDALEKQLAQELEEDAARGKAADQVPINKAEKKAEESDNAKETQVDQRPNRDDAAADYKIVSETGADGGDDVRVDQSGSKLVRCHDDDQGPGDEHVLGAIPSLISEETYDDAPRPKGDEEEPSTPPDDMLDSASLDGNATSESMDYGPTQLHEDGQEQDKPRELLSSQSDDSAQEANVTKLPIADEETDAARASDLHVRFSSDHGSSSSSSSSDGNFEEPNHDSLSCLPLLPVPKKAHKQEALRRAAVRTPQEEADYLAGREAYRQRSSEAAENSRRMRAAYRDPNRGRSSPDMTPTYRPPWALANGGSFRIFDPRHRELTPRKSALKGRGKEKDKDKEKKKEREREMGSSVVGSSSPLVGGAHPEEQGWVRGFHRPGVQGERAAVVDNNSAAAMAESDRLVKELHIMARLKQEGIDRRAREAKKERQEAEELEQMFKAENRKPSSARSKTRRSESGSLEESLADINHSSRDSSSSPESDFDLPLFSSKPLTPSKFDGDESCVSRQRPAHALPQSLESPRRGTSEFKPVDRLAQPSRQDGLRSSSDDELYWKDRARERARTDGGVYNIAARRAKAARSCEDIDDIEMTDGGDPPTLEADEAELLPADAKSATTTRVHEAEAEAQADAAQDTEQAKTAKRTRRREAKERKRRRRSSKLVRSNSTGTAQERTREDLEAPMPEEGPAPNQLSRPDDRRLLPSRPLLEHRPVFDNRPLLDVVNDPRVQVLVTGPKGGVKSLGEIVALFAREGTAAFM